MCYVGQIDNIRCINRIVIDWLDDIMLVDETADDLIMYVKTSLDNIRFIDL